MLEEHRTEQVGHNVDHIPRRVESPAVGAPMPGSMPAGGPASRMMEPQRHTASPAQHAGQQYRPQVEDLFNQLQSQLHVHSDILEDQRRHIERLDAAIWRLQQDQNTVFNTIRDLQTELASRPSAPTDAPDSNEIDILTDQLRNVTAKVNEVEGLKLEVSIMRRQMRRLDRHGSPAPSGLSAGEQPLHDHAHPAPPPHAQNVQPSFVTSTPSAPEPRPILYQTPQEHRLPPPILPGAESRDAHASTEARTLPSFRSIDPASSTSTVSGWRPAGGYAPGPAGIAPPAGPPTSTPQAETPAVSGWAAVNASAAPKRTVPVDGHAAGYEAGQPGSPKRQRLAPLMPRVNYGEQSQSDGASPYQASEATPNSLPPVPSLANSRNPSNESAVSLAPPANPLRFVLSTQEAPSEDSWRPDSQRPTIEGGRGGRASPRPRGGRGGGRGRGRKSGGPEEHGTPDWEQSEWTGGHTGPNGFYQPGLHPQDQEAARGNLVRRGGGHVGAPSDRPLPAGGPPPVGMPPSADPAQQLVQHQQHLPQSSLYPDPHFMPITTTADVAAATNANSASNGPGSNPNTPGHPTKKTRTKPIRNADGVLIRKDGRPDMRSVSSAMNLKKVHAKKEAERQSKEASEDGSGGKSNNAGLDGTPRSTSSHDHDHENGAASPNTPSQGRRMGMAQQSDDEDEDMEDEDDDDSHHQLHHSGMNSQSHTPNHSHASAAHDKHAANMRKIFPYGIDERPTLAQAFFPSGADGRGPPEVKIEADSTKVSRANTAALGDRDRAIASHERTGPAAVDGVGEKVSAGHVGVGPAASTEHSTPAAPVSAAPAAAVPAQEERKDVEMGEAATAATAPAAPVVADGA